MSVPIPHLQLTHLAIKIIMPEDIIWLHWIFPIPARHRKKYNATYRHIRCFQSYDRTSCIHYIVFQLLLVCTHIDPIQCRMGWSCLMCPSSHSRTLQCKKTIKHDWLTLYLEHWVIIMGRPVAHGLKPHWPVTMSHRTVVSNVPVASDHSKKGNTY